MDNETIDLNGKRILIVEDEFVLATAMARELETLGATVVGPAPTAFYALQLIGPEKRRKLHAAVLDVRLHREDVFKVAEVLQERGIPFVFATGYGREAIPRRFSEQHILHKPVSSEALCSAIMKIVHMQPPRPTPPPLPPVRTTDEPPAVLFARVIARTLLREEPASTAAEKKFDVPEPTIETPEEVV